MKNRHKELINQLTDKELLFHLYATQLALIGISFILILLLPGENNFLNLFNWGDKAVFTIGLPAGLAVVALDITMMRILPPSYFDDGGLNDKIFSGRSIPHIAIIAMVVAISEEILFRGIIQEKTGLIVASIIFAVIHFRYLFNWFLFLNIVVLSFCIGAIYSWTGNLAVTVAMHFVIDFALGIILKVKNEKGGLENE